MALYVIGDTHLSLGSSKPMDVFGGAWEGYVEKLTEGLSVLTDEDTLVIAGDVSWGMSLEESEKDFAWLNSWPGKKIILKGNHDYWWNTASKMNRFFQEKGFDTLHILHNNCHYYGDIALCGTRGWFYEEEKEGQSAKVFNRELQRLETSLKAAGEAEKLCFLHYPPYYTGYICQPILDILEKYRVKTCYYGHLHGGSHRLAVQGERGGVAYRLISADFLKFRPEKIME
ncbi:MAG: metallophosphoesterase [Ruminiclostridium sp.]|nr:metallophosphoesterase [Ruminiclostridium sp.]MBQ9932723.1 metallophosphoesterase [Ruminiclostridium sp.]